MVWPGKPPLSRTRSVPAYHMHATPTYDSSGGSGYVYEMGKALCVDLTREAHSAGNLIPQVLRLRAFGIDYLGKPTFSKKRENWKIVHC